MSKDKSSDFSVRVPDERHEFKGHSDALNTWCVVLDEGAEHGYCGQLRDAACHAVEPPRDEHLYPHERCMGCGEMFETTNQRLTHWCKAAASSTQPDAAGDSAEVRHLLQCLAEEHSESAVAISKCLRFGMLDNFTGDQAINYVVLEHNDVLAVIELLAERGVMVPRIDDLIQKKKAKLTKMMDYAHEKGML